LEKKLRINENYVYELSKYKSISRTKELLMMILLFPFSILGMIHCGLPYILIKRFVEKSFRRRVFWGSVKLILGMVIIGIINIPAIFLFYYLVYPSYWLGFVYYGTIGLFGLSAYMWYRNLVRFKEKGIVRKANLSKIVEKRNELMEKINALIPVA
jgi:hypothetical protein